MLAIGFEQNHPRPMQLSSVPDWEKRVSLPERYFMRWVYLFLSVAASYIVAAGVLDHYMHLADYRIAVPVISVVLFENWDVRGFWELKGILVLALTSSACFVASAGFEVKPRTSLCLWILTTVFFSV
jgi:hypothetical protein